MGTEKYKLAWDKKHKCTCNGKCGHPKAKLSLSENVIVDCTDVDKKCPLKCPFWEGVQWELRYGVDSMKMWVGWLECRCDVNQNCEWYNEKTGDLLMNTFTALHLALSDVTRQVTVQFLRIKLVMLQCSKLMLQVMNHLICLRLVSEALYVLDSTKSIM